MTNTYSHFLNEGVGIKSTDKSWVFKYFEYTGHILG